MNSVSGPESPTRDLSWYKVPPLCPGRSTTLSAIGRWRSWRFLACPDPLQEVETRESLELWARRILMERPWDLLTLDGCNKELLAAPAVLLGDDDLVNDDFVHSRNTKFVIASRG